MDGARRSPAGAAWAGTAVSGAAITVAAIKASPVSRLIGHSIVSRRNVQYPTQDLQKVQSRITCHKDQICLTSDIPAFGKAPGYRIMDG